MTKKTKHLGLESGKSSTKWFTPNPQPHAGNGQTGRPLLKAIRMIFRDPSGRKQK